MSFIYKKIGLILSIIFSVLVFTTIDSSASDFEKYRENLNNFGFNSYVEYAGIYRFYQFENYPWYSKYESLLREGKNNLTGYSTNVDIRTKSRSEKYKLVKKDYVKFLIDYNDHVCTYMGSPDLPGQLFVREPYISDTSSREQPDYSVVEFNIMPGEESKLFIDADIQGYHDRQTTSYTNNPNFIMILYNDTDLVYFTNSYCGWYLDDEYDNSYSDHRVQLQLNRPGKVTVIASTDVCVNHRITLRQAPEFNYNLKVLYHDNKLIGDNTINVPIYKLEKDSKINSESDDLISKHLQDSFRFTINNTEMNYKTDTELGYYNRPESIKYYTDSINNFTQIGDKYYCNVRIDCKENLNPTYTESGYYGSSLANLLIEIPVVEGRPVIGRLKSVLDDYNIKSTDIVISDDDNRSYSVNNDNVVLIKELSEIIDSKQLKVYFIGAYESENLFKDLLE